MGGFSTEKDHAEVVEFFKVGGLEKFFVMAGY
jgi:hypothetical protein